MVQTLYSDNTFSYSTPTISSSYEAAKDAYNETIQAEQDILDLQNLGLSHGYIWDNMTYAAATNTIPVYPVGSYIASGMLVDGNRTITRNNSNTYGLNTWISTGGINLRYNAIDLMKLTTSNLEFYYPSTSSQGTKAISLGTNGAVNSLVFYGFNNSNKTMELTNSALNFYGSSTSTPDATLTSTGLVLSKGGIVAGTKGQSGYIYLSTENHPVGTNGITINDFEPTSSTEQWREVIGTNFGVTNAGTLYASNANINGAIEATSLDLSPDNVNNQTSTLEEIIGALSLISQEGVFERTSDVVPQEHKWYFLHDTINNSYEVQENVVFEYVATTDTSVVSGKTYYTRTGSGTEESPYVYDEVDNIVGNENPSSSSWYEYTAWNYYELVNLQPSIQNYISSHIKLVDGKLLIVNGSEQLKLSPDEGLIFSNGLGQVAQYGKNIVLGNLYETGIQIGEGPDYELTQDTTVNENKTYYIRTGNGTEASPYIYTEVSNPSSSANPKTQGWYQHINELGFYQGNERVAYINNKSLYITQTVVLEEMKIGNQQAGTWAWRIHEVNDKNNLYLKWLG